MTEDQVERIVERRVDGVDALYMAGRMDDAEYVRQMNKIAEWADIEFGWSLSEQRAKSRLNI